MNTIVVIGEFIRVDQGIRDCCNSEFILIRECYDMVVSIFCKIFLCLLKKKFINKTWSRIS